MDDVVNDGNTLYSTLQDSVVAKLLETSKHSFYRKMYKRIIESGGFQSSMESAIKNVRESGLAFIGDQPILENLNSRQPCDTMIVKYVLEMQNYAFGLQLRSEWTNHLSVHLLHVSYRLYVPICFYICEMFIRMKHSASQQLKGFKAALPSNF